MNFKKALSLSLLVGFLCVGAIGCGDDSDDGDPAGSGGSAGSTGGTGGTTGGSGGMSGSGGGGTGGGGTGGTTGGSGGAPATVMCGAATCMGATVQGQMLPPCCDTVNGMICGLRTSATNPMECTGLMQEGTDVTTDVCPTIKNALEMDAQPCCKPEGKCGFRSLSLMGCIERSIYPTAFLSMMEPVTSMFPLQSIDCPVDGEDAGAE